MKIVYNKNDTQIAEFPEHKRTICFQEDYKQRFVLIPASYVIVCYYNKVKYGKIISKDLNHYLDFGNDDLCFGNLILKSIQEYFGWYWNSQFLYLKPHNHLKLNNFCLRHKKVSYFNFAIYLLLQKNKEKTKVWAKANQSHLKTCPICQEFANNFSN